MDEIFLPDELLFRAVYPPELAAMFWCKDGSVSSAAFADPKGLSVERGYYRENSRIIESMSKRFTGIIVALSVSDCVSVRALVLYLPSKTNPFHSEIHGSEKEPLLSKSQRLYLSKRAKLMN